MKTLALEFKDGEALLGSYWGLLSSGGLRLDGDPGTFTAGQEVLLKVRLRSSGVTVPLRAKVVLPSGAAQTLLVFAAGEPHDVLLAAAWADMQGIAPRGGRRQSASGPVLLHRPGTSRPWRGHLVDLSLGGAGIRLEGSLSPWTTGDPVRLETEPNGSGEQGLSPVDARVAWRCGLALGVRWENPQGAGLLRWFTLRGR